jgi:hypothetical protein
MDFIKIKAEELCIYEFIIKRCFSKVLERNIEEENLSPFLLIEFLNKIHFKNAGINFSFSVFLFDDCYYLKQIFSLTWNILFWKTWKTKI